MSDHLPPAIPADMSGLDADTLAAHFRRQYPRIYNYLRYRIRHQQDAEDLSAQVFEQAFARRAQFDPQRGSFSAWIFRIAHNLCVDYYRRQSREAGWLKPDEALADLATDEASPERSLSQEETRRQLLVALDELSDRDQEIISLKFAGGLRNKDIAEIMAMKEKTVSVVLLRALRRLRQFIEAEEKIR